MARKIKNADIMEPRVGDLPAKTRELAALYRFPFYRTRATCRNGHRAARATNSGECLECTAGRWTRWAEAHPEKAREKLNRVRADKDGLPPLLLALPD